MEKFDIWKEGVMQAQTERVQGVSG